VSLYTYTHAYTRADAVADQVSVLFTRAGIDSADTARVLRGVNERWLDAVGLYLTRNAARVYEIEARLSWPAHSDLAELGFSSDLPGWEGNGSPEAIILGDRFSAVASKHGLARSWWVLFTPAIRAEPARHGQLRSILEVGGSVPAWGSIPTTRSLPLQDLREVGMSERSTL
jgi:hypothetical protein